MGHVDSIVINISDNRQFLKRKLCYCLQRYVCMRRQTKQRHTFHTGRTTYERMTKQRELVSNDLTMYSR